MHGPGQGARGAAGASASGARRSTRHTPPTPSLLAIEGRSGGGITVGMALTERPDLFRGVFSGVGDSNALCAEEETDGAANSLEYGTTKEEAGFNALYAVDATQHVRAGTRYRQIGRKGYQPAR